MILYDLTRLHGVAIEVHPIYEDGEGNKQQFQLLIDGKLSRTFPSADLAHNAVLIAFAVAEYRITQKEILETYSHD